MPDIMTQQTTLPNAPVKQSALKRVTLKIFSGLNTFRKIMINILFFIILFLFIAAITSDEGEVIVPNNSALVLNISGDIVEQKRSVDPMDAFINEALKEQQKNPEVLYANSIWKKK